MALAWGQVKAEESAIKIVSPLPDSIVERVTEVVVETTKAGHPLVLVRSLDATVEWWAQPVVAHSDPGRITMKCYFGNAKTRDGQAFQMVAMLVPTDQQVKTLAKQQVFGELPKRLAYSEPRRVVRTNDEVKATTIKTVATVTESSSTVVASAPTTLLGLSNRSQVSRRHELSARAKEGAVPLLLVRSTAKNSRWWVQAPAKVADDGRFTVTVRFGNEKTPAGSEFELAAVTLANADDAASFKAGDSFPELPESAKKADRVTVVLEADAATGAE